jgi:hypothetical protein
MVEMMNDGNDITGYFQICLKQALPSLPNREAIEQ